MTLLLSPQSSWFVSLLLTTTLSGNNETFLATHGVITLVSTQIPTCHGWLNYQLDIAYSHLRREPHLRSCLHNICL